MSDYFITSDLHLMHNKNFLFEPRGFSSTEEMCEAIVERWNRIVKPEDIIYNLGDLALSDVDAAIPYIKRLNGFQWWIRGNHCTINKVKKICEECKNISTISNPEASWATMLKFGKKHFFLCHYPTIVNNTNDKPVYCLCGHTHTKNKWEDFDKGCYHVEMDAHDCYPVSLEEIISDINSRKNEFILPEDTEFKIPIGKGMIR